MIISHITMPEFADRMKSAPAVILPVGALEQHGPHLPLGLDAMHAYALAKETARLEPCLVAPPLCYGMCRSTSQHPGTVGISGRTLRGLIHDIGLSFASQGADALCIVTGHAGGTHQMALVEAGEGLLAETTLEVAVVCVLDLLKDEPDLLECDGDSHAGEMETSMVMHLWPEMVSGTAPEEYPTFPDYILVRDKKAHWPGGVWGDPSKASAAKGEAILKAEARALAKVVADLKARATASRD